jgi:hypothetical protein
MTQEDEKYTIKSLRMKYGPNYTEIHQLVSDYGKKLDCCPQNGKKWEMQAWNGLCVS